MRYTLIREYFRQKQAGQCDEADHIFSSFRDCEKREVMFWENLIRNQLQKVIEDVNHRMLAW